jgi:arabinofuranosyltransferase
MAELRTTNTRLGDLLVSMPKRRRLAVGLGSITVGFVGFVAVLTVGLLSGDGEVGQLLPRVAVVSLVFLALGAVTVALKRLPMLAVVVLSAALLLYAGGVSYIFPFQVDDAYISMRYASHLAEGQGLVFNPGGPRVEGYTNLLLVLIEAGLMRLGFHVLWPVKLVTTTCGILTLLVIAWYGFRRLASARGNASSANIAVGASLLITASSAPLIFWSSGGLETMLFAFLICLAAVLYCTYLLGQLSGAKTWSIDAVLFLAILTRPEGLLFWILTVAHTALLWIAKRQLPTRARWLGIISGSVMIIGYAIWKQWYFGQLLPLTYLAKERSLSIGATIQGGKRFVELLAIDGNFVVVAAVILGLLWAARSRRSLKSPLWYLFALLLFYPMYVMSRGYQVAMDDAYRFWVPVVPLLSVLFVELWHSVSGQVFSQEPQAGRIAVTVVLTTIAVLLPIRALDLRSGWAVDMNWGALDYRLSARQISSGLQNAHIKLGKWLRENAPPGAKIVLWDAGAIPYFSRLQTIDTWSLNDPKIVGYKRALAASTSPEETQRINEQLKSYVLDQAPDYIIQDGLALLDSPETQAEYEPIGAEFTYLASYDCGGGMCDYIIAPQRRMRSTD